MSVTFSDFLSAWNETMQVQIREVDVKNPSEPSFRRWLITILRQFFVNTQVFENMDNESGNRLKASRVRLVATVNHFYKIAFPSAKQDFVYFDLIQPCKLNFWENFKLFSKGFKYFQHSKEFSTFSTVFWTTVRSSVTLTLPQSTI